MIATNDNLYDIAREARAAKASGATTIDFEIEASCGFTAWVTLWEGIPARVVGRIFEDPQEPAVSGIPQPRTVKYFTVRANIVDICEAQRRRMEREAREFGGSVPLQ